MGVRARAHARCQSDKVDDFYITFHKRNGASCATLRTNPGVVGGGGELSENKLVLWHFAFLRPPITPRGRRSIGVSAKEKRLEKNFYHYTHLRHLPVFQRQRAPF